MILNMVARNIQGTKDIVVDSIPRGSAGVAHTEVQDFATEPFPFAATTEK